MQNIQWSNTEKAVARHAFDQAYENECRAIHKEVRRLADQLASPQDIWAIHDYLTGQRKAISQKYDYRYSQLIWIFAILVDEGWIHEADLAGLSEEKLQQIREVVEFRRSH